MVLWAISYGSEKQKEFALVNRSSHFLLSKCTTHPYPVNPIEETQGSNPTKQRRDKIFVSAEQIEASVVGL